jgi:Zn-finger nucleic acid-binding protein
VISCASCSAPLPAQGVVCAYCGSRVDVDLHGWSHLQPSGLSDQLHCPDGHGALETLELPGVDSTIELGRCPTCLGLFLPLGSLEQLLDQAVAPVWSVDRQLLHSLAERPRADSGPVRYRPCPSCGDLMNRSLHGKRSGVVVDRCRDHGLWLDAGELRQLLEWARAGGALLDQEWREQEARERAAQEEAERQDLAGLEARWEQEEMLQRHRGSQSGGADLMTLLVKLARRLV